MPGAAKLFKAKDPKDRALHHRAGQAGQRRALVVKGTHRRTGLAREHACARSCSTTTPTPS